MRDLKSVVRKDLRVRLPPSAPLSTFLLQQLTLFPEMDGFARDEGKMSQQI